MPTARTTAGVQVVKLALLSAVVAWVGATMLLSSVRWFIRPSLTDRLRPYSSAPVTRPRCEASSPSPRSADVLGPLLAEVGERLATLRVPPRVSRESSSAATTSSA